MKKIILDTNIISTFQKIDEMELLRSLFQKHTLAIPPGVRDELCAAGIDSNLFSIVRLSNAESKMKERIGRKHGSLGCGEIECIAVSKARSIMMLTNDRKAKYVAREIGIRCYDLPEILKAMRMKGLVELDELRNIVKKIESKDNIIFKNVERLIE